MTLRVMVGALWYLQSRSIANAVRSRVRRLRQPKYLIGFIIGGLYIISVVGRWVVGARLMRGNRPGGFVPMADPEWVENLGATALLGTMFLGWILAKDRAALAFTEAEVSNLFPAPLSRSLLIWYRIFRRQTAILFTTLMLLIFTGRIALGGSAILAALGWWVLLSTLSLHGLGASFAVQRLTERGLASGWRRAATLAVPVSLLVLLALWYRSLPPPPELEGEETPTRLLMHWQHFSAEVFRSGPAPWLLAPFRWVVRPLFATGWIDAIGRFLPALAILALHAVWVQRSAVSFEEASITQARWLAERVASARRGQFRLRAQRRSGEPFRLGPVGPRWMAWWWCGLIESRDTPRWWLVWAGTLAVGVAALRYIAMDTAVPLGVGVVALVVAGVTVLLGGQSSAQRFARVLRRLDLAKAFPVAGWEVYLGSVLGGLTGSVLTVWLMLGVATGLLAGTTERWLAGGPGVGSLGLAAAALAVMAPVVSLFLALPVCVGSVLFPAWFTAARTNPGIEMLGQRMLVGLFQMVFLLVAAVPVAVGALPVYFLGAWLIGPIAGAVGAALMGTGVLAAECALGVWWIGRRFDALNASDEA